MHMTSGASLIALRDVTVEYGRVVALRNASLDVAPARVYGIVGPNGAGKSTLVKVISGAVIPSQGTLTVAGQPAAFGDQRRAIALGIRLVPQEMAVIDSLTVSAFINLGAEIRVGPLLREKAMAQHARRALEQVGSGIDVARLVGSLSISERRLVMVAKALDPSLRVLVLDEPTAAMSAQEAAIVLAAVDVLRKSGIATLLVSHRLDEIASVCDEVVGVRDGQVSEVASNQGVATVQEIARFIGDTGEARHRPSTPARDGSAVVEFEGAVVPGRAALSFEAYEGEIVGVLGKPGSGAEQLLEILAGIRRTDGTIRVHGEEVRLRSPAAAQAAGIGYLPADRAEAGISRYSILANVSLSSLRALARAGVVTKRRERALAWRYLPAHLAERMESELETLSGGNRQRVLVARLLAAGATGLILNNPTAGIDVAARRVVLSELVDTVAAGRCVVMYTSQPEELVGFAGRVYAFAGGELVAVIDGADATDVVLWNASIGAPDIAHRASGRRSGAALQ